MRITVTEKRTYIVPPDARKGMRAHLKRWKEKRDNVADLDELISDLEEHGFCDGIETVDVAELK